MKTVNHEMTKLWIDIWDDIPETSFGVLCVQELPNDKHIMFIGYYNGREWFEIDWNNDDDIPRTPTHWQYLPNKPETYNV